MYSRDLPAAVGEATREQKARQICAVLEHYCGPLERLSALDYGCSTGLMTAYFAARFGHIVGADVDDAALATARGRFPALTFERLPLERRDGQFDIIIANQIYYCVPDHASLLAAIRRLLKPGGTCFFGARNKYALVEAQYHLPFLSMLPPSVGRRYLRLFRGTSTSVGPYYLSRTGLLRLFEGFQVIDCTLDILKRPEVFGFTGIPTILRYLPLQLMRGLIPNYIFLLRK